MGHTYRNTDDFNEDRRYRARNDRNFRRNRKGLRTITDTTEQGNGIR